jgi:hypothetical protein
MPKFNKQFNQQWAANEILKLRIMQVNVRKHILFLSFVSVVGVALFFVGYASYMATTQIAVPFNVKDPIELTNYPSSVSVYPGDVATFEVTVINHASHVRFGVEWNLSLGNKTYEDNYVISTSRGDYYIYPGTQNVTLFLQMSPDAPPLNAMLNITWQIKDAIEWAPESLSIEATFDVGSHTLLITLTNTNYMNGIGNPIADFVTIREVQVNCVIYDTNPPLPVTVSIWQKVTLNVTLPSLAPGDEYQLQLYSSRDTMFIHDGTVPIS